MSFNYKNFAQDLRPRARELADRILEPDGVHRRQPSSKYAGWVCSCGSGSGDNGTGLTEKGGLFSCWSCGFKGDILDIIGQRFNITEPMEIAKKAAELASIDINRYNDNFTTQQNTQFNTQFNTQQKKAELPQESQADFIAAAAERIEQTDYHRGLSLETLKRFNIGFVPDYKHSEKSKPEPALIIPTSQYSYAARIISKQTDEKYKYLKKGTVHLFNGEALYNSSRPLIFITEGELDALSIIDAGGEAVGLGAAGNYTLLVKTIEQSGKPTAPLALVLDNDEPGKEAAEKLTAELDRLEVQYYYEGVHLYSDNAKDANEALNTDRDTFKMLIQALEGVPAADFERAAAKYREQYSVKAATTDFISKVITEYEAPIKSGWESLDELLGGGIYPGLYFIGALSSMGKTTYALQLADQIAESGQDTLVISLEQSKDELMAKSISRYTYLIESEKPKPNYRNAKTVRGILDGSRYKNYSREEYNLIEAAIDRYNKTAAPHLFIIEGNGDIDTDAIRAAVENHTRLTGKAPVVFIDYLQIIKDKETKKTDKQKTDDAVGDLYRIARDFKTPVLAISSFNRNSYNSDAAMDSFKESGGIEYSGDYVIALQPSGVREGVTKDDIKANKKLFKKTKAATIRQLEAVILKNRSGATEVKYSLEYNAMFNYIEDKGIPEKKKEDYSFTKK